MKKLLFVVTLAFALTGCGGNPPSLEDRVADGTYDESEELTYNGIIEALEIDVYQQGTHQIRTEDGELIIIQSQNYDLGKFLDKQVEITGYPAELIGNAEPVLNVTGVRLEDDELIGEFDEYENSLYGFSFEYPKIWELQSGSGGISLVYDDYDWVTIDIYIDKTDLDAFVDSQEDSEGTPITIAAQKSIRFSDGDSIKIYIPNPPKKKIYKVVFNEESNDADGNKELFYEFLESFELIYKSVRKGEKCGGEENIECGEGYICELSSAEEDATGICVSISGEDGEKDCPIIPPPLDCDDYRVSEYSQTTGCPSRYECTDDSTGLSEEDDVDFDVTSLISTIEKYQDKILPIDDVSIVQYELTESESLIAIVYENEEMEYKTLYSYAPSANEFNFIEKAHFEEGDGEDWRLISGTDVQSGLTKTVIKAESGDEESGSREISSDMRLYENDFKDFSMEYPKNWYYRSFGAINNTRWIVGFADKSVEYLSDAVVTVSILDEEPEDSQDGMYFTVRDRDEDTVFVVEGPEDMKETIDEMADSIE